MRRLAGFTFLAGAVLTACLGPSATPAASGRPDGTAGSVATERPVGGAELDAGELRLLLMDHLGPHWYCDPDEYPVSRGTEQERALERFSEMQAEGAIFRAVAAALDIDVNGAVTDADKLAIYRIWKVALAVQLDPVGDGTYRFDYLAQPVGGAADGTRTTGLLSSKGLIQVEHQAPAGEPICPICLTRGTRIDTPDGPVPVDALRLGVSIWTIDADGRRTEGTVIALGSTEAPPTHRVIHLVLADGRTITASPGHPLADGRQLGAVVLGDVVDGSAIVSLERLPYGGSETFDLVASGATGGYYADGIPLGTTLLP